MKELPHICHKCRKDTKINTFFANKIPTGDDSGEYRVEQEWICVDCMTSMMEKEINSAMLLHDPAMAWFPLHKRLSLEFEDEVYGSFSVRVWHAEELERVSEEFGAHQMDITTISGRRVFIFEATNLTYDETAIFSFAVPDCSNIPRYVKSGMCVAIETLYAQLLDIRQLRQSVRSKEP